MPFHRMLRYHELPRPGGKHNELRSIVETQISYNNLPSARSEPSLIAASSAGPTH